ncbi:MAG TPA: hypothetical protein VK276_06600 [Rubrobacteraceae bacterium]|nr:hypothetical protein [Rubrobacteraceae bacterium]
MAENLRVGVVGTGYVGLVTRAFLAHLWHRVACVDRDEERVRVLRSERMPVYEPGLEELVSRAVGRASRPPVTRRINPLEYAPARTI